MRNTSLLMLLVACADEKADTAEPTACSLVSTDTLAQSIQALVADDAGVVWASDGTAKLRFNEGDGWETLSLPAGVTNTRGLSEGGGALYTWDRDTIYRYDGAWTNINLPAEAEVDELLVRADGVLSVWGAVETDGCEDCEDPWGYALFEYDGLSWIEADTLWVGAPLRALTEVDGVLVLVGDSGQILVEDGGSWTAIDVGLDTMLWDATASGDELVAVGVDGVMVSGGLDALVASTIDADLDLIEVSAEPDGSVWTLAAEPGYEVASTFMRIEGGLATTVESGYQGLTTLVATGEDEVVAGGGDEGTLLVRGGTTGFEAEIDVVDLTEAWELWVSDSGLVYAAAGQAGLRRWTDGTSSVLATEPDSEFTAVDGQDETVVAVHNKGIVFWDGTSANGSTPSDTLDYVELRDVAALDESSAIVVGFAMTNAEEQSGVAWQVDGEIWTRLTDAPSGEMFTHVAALSESSIYALSYGDENHLYAGDGASWTALGDALADDPTALWVSSEDEIYVGLDWMNDSALYVWDGSALSEVAGGPPRVSALVGVDAGLLVSGTDADELGGLWLWDGADWTRLLELDSPPSVGASAALWAALSAGQMWTTSPCEWSAI